MVLDDHRYAMMMHQNAGHFKFAGPKPDYYTFSTVEFPGDEPSRLTPNPQDEWTAEDDAQWNKVFNQIVMNHQQHENGY